jgi:hypothetical protein
MRTKSPTPKRPPPKSGKQVAVLVPFTPLHCGVIEWEVFPDGTETPPTVCQAPRDGTTRCHHQRGSDASAPGRRYGLCLPLADDVSLPGLWRAERDLAGRAMPGVCYRFRGRVILGGLRRVTPITRARQRSDPQPETGSKEHRC